ncbi:MAG: hypothetical protein CMI90_05905 [Pelagibacteraceae bacterium]|nr:hypothetical protein [Pelagibacteraceae bacterium]
MKKVLFISYDGILEPLGFSQILSYLLPLSKSNKLTVFSFEKKIDLENNDHYVKIKNLMDKHNITWKYFIYKKNYFKYINILKVFFYSLYYAYTNKINIIHARSYIPALISYFIKKFINIKLIFDMRGFWINERVEWNIWSKKSLIYIFFKYYEKKIIYNSDAIITLTQIASKIIKNKYSISNSKIKFESIPTCVKLNANPIKFNTNKDNIIISHLGAIGTRYDFDKYLRLGNLLNKRLNIFHSIINKGEHDYIIDKFTKNNTELLDYEIKYSLPYDINKCLEKVDIGVFFPVKGFYLNGYFPTKLGEFLTNGIPIITSKINEDVDSIILKNKIGIIIEDLENFLFDQTNYEIFINLLSKQTSKKCTQVAEKYFDVNKAIYKYNSIYKSF